MSIDIRSQRIARSAFERVERRARHDSGKPDEYLSFARSFPTMIHTSGLSQAVAFALAKGIKQADKRHLIDDLCHVLHETDCGWQLEPGEITDGKALDCKARNEDKVEAYMRLTRHALQAATWIKRYAEALLTVPETRPVDPNTEEIAKS